MDSEVGKAVDRIFDKLNAMSDDLTELKVSQARMATILESQSEILETHVKRTNALEERINQFEKTLGIHKSFYKLIAWLVPVVVSVMAIIMKCFSVF
jgi:Zn-dependent M32 family carboxypeptidase